MWQCVPPEIVQYASNVIAVVCSCGFHSFIIIRIIANYYKLSHYRNFVVAQSAVYILDSVIKFIRNKALCGVMTNYVLSFVSYNPEVMEVFKYCAEAISHLEMTLLAIFNIYRTATIVSPRFEILWYVMVISITAVSYVTTLVSFFINSGELREVSLLLQAVNALPTVICYVVIRWHFRGIRSSDIVKRMQSKLSFGLLLQLLLQLIDIGIIWSGFVFFWFDIFPDDNSNPGLQNAVDLYFAVSDMFMVWVPALTGLLIMWSISGFLQPKKTHLERLSVSNITLQQRFCPGSRVKLSQQRRCSKISSW
ncbi:hypothetical protein Aduo_007077 [Ancylostoma duodenale]